MEHRTPNIQHPTSNIQHPTSNIQHPTSNIQHPSPHHLITQHPTAPTPLCSITPSPQGPKPDAHARGRFDGERTSASFHLLHLFPLPARGRLEHRIGHVIRGQAVLEI